MRSGRAQSDPRTSVAVNKLGQDDPTFKLNSTCRFFELPVYSLLPSPCWFLQSDKMQCPPSSKRPASESFLSQVKSTRRKLAVQNIELHTADNAFDDLDIASTMLELSTHTKIGLTYAFVEGDDDDALSHIPDLTHSLHTATTNTALALLFDTRSSPSRLPQSTVLSQELAGDERPWDEDLSPNGFPTAPRTDHCNFSTHDLLADLNVEPYSIQTLLPIGSTDDILSGIQDGTQVEQKVSVCPADLVRYGSEPWSTYQLGRHPGGDVPDQGDGMPETTNSGNLDVISQDNNCQPSVAESAEFQEPHNLRRAGRRAGSCEVLPPAQSDFSTLELVRSDIEMSIRERRGRAEELTCWSCFGKKEGVGLIFPGWSSMQLLTNTSSLVYRRIAVREM